MPSQQQMKAALQAYIDGFNNGDADAVIALFAPDATIEDPVGSPIKGRAEFEAFYRTGVAWGSKLALAAPIRGSHGNAAAMAFTVRTLNEGRPVVIHSLDTVTFDDAGLITHLKGYWGPEDIELLD